ncbi:DUF1963 domain-containing protein [Paractinoplanes durhamensis]|nr:DUF1963 domain-containing protein [Actinoplanes durhamensis]
MLMIYDGPVAPDAPGTRTGGLPLVPPAFEWPRCRECDGAMQFLAQVSLADIDPGDDGLLSIFMCANDPGLCDEWDAAGGGNRAFVFGADAVGVAEPPGEEFTLLAETSGVAFEEELSDEDYLAA